MSILDGHRKDHPGSDRTEPQAPHHDRQLQFCQSSNDLAREASCTDHKPRRKCIGLLQKAGGFLSDITGCPYRKPVDLLKDMIPSKLSSVKNLLLGGAWQVVSRVTWLLGTRSEAAGPAPGTTECPVLPLSLPHISRLIIFLMHSDVHLVPSRSAGHIRLYLALLPYIDLQLLPPRQYQP